jgi:hypothetical protein
VKPASAIESLVGFVLACNPQKWEKCRAKKCLVGTQMAPIEHPQNTHIPHWPETLQNSPVTSWFFPHILCDQGLSTPLGEFWAFLRWPTSYALNHHATVFFHSLRWMAAGTLVTHQSKQTSKARNTQPNKQKKQTVMTWWQKVKSEKWMVPQMVPAT